MTNSISAPAARGLSWTRIGLGLSIALNLCFLGGYLYRVGFATPPTDAQRFERLTGELKFSEPQRAALEAMRESMRKSAIAAREVGQNAMADITAEFTKEEPSRPVIDDAVRRFEDARCGVLKNRAEAFVGFLAQLDPARRVELMRFVRTRAAETPLWMRPGR